MHLDDVYFKNVMDDIGDLLLYKVYIEYESEPILLVCKDRNDNIYFCICLEIRYIKKWVIAKITLVDLYDLENQKIDIYSAMIKSDIIINIVQSIDEKETVTFGHIDKDDITEGVFLKCRDDTEI